MPRKNWHSMSEYQALRAMMEGNTTASAARRLGLSQSAVSRSISNLEARIGVTLFERESGRLTPTVAAVSLNLRLDALFEALDDIDGPAETSRETLHLIAPPTYAGQFLVAHMASFHEANPDIFLSLEIGTSETVLAGVVGGAFDLGLTGVELSRAGARMVPFRKSTAACALPDDHPLARRDIIRPVDLHGLNLIALIYRHARRAHLDRLMHEAGSKPKIVMEISTSAAAIDLVRQGLGIAVVNPFPSVQHAPQGVVMRPFSSAITYQTYFVVPDQRPLSRAARRFMRHLRMFTPRDAFSQTV